MLGKATWHHRDALSLPLPAYSSIWNRTRRGGLAYILRLQMLAYTTISTQKLISSQPPIYHLGCLLKTWNTGSLLARWYGRIPTPLTSLLFANPIWILEIYGHDIMKRRIRVLPLFQFDGSFLVDAIPFYRHIPSDGHVTQLFSIIAGLFHLKQLTLASARLLRPWLCFSDG